MGKRGPKNSVQLLDDRIRAECDRLVRDGAAIDDIVSHLRSLGAAVSRSAVGRYKRTQEKTLEDYRRVQEMTRVWMREVGSEPEGDIARLIAEVLKTQAFLTIGSLAEGGESVAPGDLMLMARMLKDVTSAQDKSIQTEQRIRAAWEAEQQARAEVAADQVAAVARTKGLSEADGARLRELVLGVVS